MKELTPVKLVRDRAENWRNTLYRLYMFKVDRYVGPISDSPDFVENWAKENGYIVV